MTRDPGPGCRRSRVPRSEGVRRAVGAGDQPHAALVGEVGDGPLDEDGQAVAEPDQPDDVDEEPEQPRRETRRSAAVRGRRWPRCGRWWPCCRGPCSGTARRGCALVGRAAPSARRAPPAASRPARRPGTACPSGRAGPPCRRRRTPRDGPGTDRSGSTSTRPARSSGTPSVAPSDDARDAGRPENRAGLDHFVAQPDLARPRSA